MRKCTKLSKFSHDPLQSNQNRSELSTDALTALQEFYSEREESETRLQSLKASAEFQAVKGQLTMRTFSEDWNASQFWYSDETATTLANQLLVNATAESHIAIVCAPSVFIKLKNLTAAKKDCPKITLLEFDNRFDVFEEFVHYDFREPLRLPLSMKATYDCVLCDPPFLSPDCHTKAAMTVRWLVKPQLGGEGDSMLRIIVCTGAIMEDLIRKLYANIRTTSFEPKHVQNRLSNEFRCYATFEGSAWSWR